jgi:hypothetical protein
MPTTVLQFRAAQPEEVSVCCECGVEFASPVIVKRKDDGQWFHCPNGHRQHYTETTEARLRKELERERTLRESAQRDSEWQRNQAKVARAQETRAKNELKRIKTRIHAGVCPHCNRTFQNIARHMETKHPCATPPTS